MSSYEVPARWPVAARRGAALLVLVIFALVGWYVLVDPARTIALSQGRWRTTVSAKLARARSTLAVEPQLKAYRETLERAPVWEKFYRRTGTETPDTQLRSRITEVAVSVGASVQSAELIPAVPMGALRRYGVRFAGTMKIDQFQKFLAALRGSVTYLRVGHLSISAPQVQKTEENPSLLVRVDLYGYSIASQEAARQ